LRQIAKALELLPLVLKFLQISQSLSPSICAVSVEEIEGVTNFNARYILLYIKHHEKQIEETASQNILSGDDQLTCIRRSIREDRIVYSQRAWNNSAGEGGTVGKGL